MGTPPLYMRTHSGGWRSRRCGGRERRKIGEEKEEKEEVEDVGGRGDFSPSLECERK